MADYKRVISYMYYYDEQVKKQNTGYARIELGGEQCKVTIHIKMFMNEKILPAYMFYRENGEMKTVLLGNVNIKNNTGECRVITKKNNIMDSGHSFEEMGGIVVLITKENYFGTEWDDHPIYFKKEKKLELADVEQEVIIEELSEKMIERKVEQEPEKMEELKVGPKPEQMVELKPDINPEKEINSIKEEKLKTAPELESEVKSVETEKHEKLNEVDKIFQTYPRMCLFEDEEIMECVRIEPRDIGIFPIEVWGLANNSFLLHGYYSYRHLIFAKRKTQDHYEYLLGVPGVFYNRERFMARMFGFGDFKSVKKKALKAGEFGYWCVNLSL